MNSAKPMEITMIESTCENI